MNNVVWKVYLIRNNPHLEIAVDDLGSKPMIKVSIGTNIPPPPTPPTLPRAAPRKPMHDPTTTLQPNSISCVFNSKQEKRHQNKSV